MTTPITVPLSPKKKAPLSQVSTAKNQQTAIYKTTFVPKKANIEPMFFEYAKTRNKKLRDEIIVKNLPLVTYIIGKYYPEKKLAAYGQISQADLIQEGIIGLISAIEGYRPELGYQFSTYSHWWIRQAVNNYLLNIEPMVHVPTHVRTATNKLMKELKEENKTFQNVLSGEHDYSGTNKMLNSIESAMRFRYITSLNAENSPPNDHSEKKVEKAILQDVLIGLTGETVDSDLDGKSLIAVVKSSFMKLPHQEKLILLLRFGIIKDISAKLMPTAKMLKEMQKRKKKNTKVNHNNNNKSKEVL